MSLCAINSRCQRSQNLCVFIAKLAQQKTQRVFSRIRSIMTEGACESNTKHKARFAVERYLRTLSPSCFASHREFACKLLLSSEKAFILNFSLSERGFSFSSLREDISLPLEGKGNHEMVDEVFYPITLLRSTSSVSSADTFPSRGRLYWAPSDEGKSKCRFAPLTHAVNARRIFVFS